MSSLGSVTFALGAAVATFFAPCAYALLPGYVGFYVASVEGDDPPLGGALVRGTAAAVGVLLTFAVLSVAALAASSAVERTLPVVEPLVGVALVLVGVAVLRSGTLSLHVALPERRASVLGFGAFGAAYALAATACVLPLFLSIVVQTVAMPVADAALVLGTFAATFGTLMLGVTVATAVGRDLSAGLLADHVHRLTRLAGVVLILAGIGQLYTALG